jgi:tetratricopeptide (TPR) repeat protein
MVVDDRGVAVATSNAAAVAALEGAVLALVCHRADLAARIDQALALDPTLALAHVLRGFALSLQARPVYDPAVERALAAVGRPGGREGVLAAALVALHRDDRRAAAAMLRRHLAAVPHDLLALKLHQAITFQDGDGRQMVEVSAAVLPYWTEDQPGFGHVLGLHAFALEEAGALDLAERVGRRAVERVPYDPWAVHAVAHVYEMRGEPAFGLAWLGTERQCRIGCGPFQRHLDWHEALFLIALGRREAALEVYDRAVWASATPEYREVANAVSLLWRLESAGVDIGDRWQGVADAAQTLAGECRLGFAHLHALIGLWRAGAPLPTAPAPKHAGVIAAAIANLSAGDAQIAARQLVAAHEQWQPLGGSHAQRDLFQRLAIDTATAVGRRDLADEVRRTRAKRFQTLAALDCAA